MKGTAGYVKKRARVGIQMGRNYLFHDVRNSCVLHQFGLLCWLQYAGSWLLSKNDRNTVCFFLIAEGRRCCCFRLSFSQCVRKRYDAQHMLTQAHFTATKTVLNLVSNQKSKEEPVQPMVYYSFNVPQCCQQHAIRCSDGLPGEGGARPLLGGRPHA